MLLFITMSMEGLKYLQFICLVINDQNISDKYWSVELAITFDALAHNSTRASPVPADDEVWFMQFGR